MERWTIGHEPTSPLGAYIKGPATERIEVVPASEVERLRGERDQAVRYLNAVEAIVHDGPWDAKHRIRQVRKLWSDYKIADCPERKGITMTTSRVKRAILRKPGEFFAVAVWTYVDAGHRDFAGWIERRCLNPIQRQLGSAVSNYAQAKREESQ